jgi:hypothetical protein
LLPYWLGCELDKVHWNLDGFATISGLQARHLLTGNSVDDIVNGLVPVQRYTRHRRAYLDIDGAHDLLTLGVSERQRFIPE